MLDSVTGHNDVMKVGLDDVVAVELTAAEWDMLGRGMIEWHGPARCTDAMACAMGFGDLAGLYVESKRLAELTRGHEPMSRWDWARLLLATEIVFASTVVGSGLGWDSGDYRISDEQSFGTLRSLQAKLVHTVGRGVMREHERREETPG